MQEVEIQEIKGRNLRVEADKAWETSKIRRGMIAVITYFAAVIFLILIEAPYPWLNAFVPTAGFILSTLTLPFCKRWWLRGIYRR